MKKLLLLPSFVFFVVWVITVLLYSLGLTTNLVPLETEAIFFLLSNLVISIFLTVLFVPFINTVSFSDANFSSSFISPKSIRALFFIWCIMLVPDIIHAGSIPLLMSIRGDGNYTHFGIPTYHGFVNLVFFIVFPTIFFYAWKTKSLFFKVSFVLMIIWEIIALRRGILLGGIIEVIFVYLLYSRLNMKLVFKFLIVLVAVVLLFGYAGDLRGVKNPYSYLINNNFPILEVLPSGFTWFYVYLTSGLSNLSFNIAEIVPVFDLTSFQDLFPSVIRNKIYGDLGFHDSMALVDSNTNVSTMYELLYPDIGIWSLLVLFIMLFIFNVAFLGFLRGRRAAVYGYLIACQSVVFSIFYNLFFIQTYFLLFFVALFFSYIRIRKNRSKVISYE